MRDYKEIINTQGFFIIAEVGVNYYDIAKKEKLSLIEAAKLMIKNAKENGADAVKFQSYKAETIVSKQAPAYWDLKEESTPSQYELFKSTTNLKNLITSLFQIIVRTKTSFLCQRLLTLKQLIS